MALKRKYKREIIYVNYNTIFDHEENHLDNTIKALLELKDKYVTNGKYDDIIFERDDHYSDEIGDMTIMGGYMESDEDYNKRVESYEKNREKSRLTKIAKEKAEKIAKENKDKADYARLKKKFEKV